MKKQPTLAVAALGFLSRQRNRITNLSIAGSSNAVLIAASLIGLAFNTRALGTADFGTFTVIQSYVALCGAICTLESWQTVCRLGADDNCDLARLCRQTATLDTLAAAASFGLAAIGLLIFGNDLGIPAEDRWLALVFSLTLLFSRSGTPKGYFRLIDRFGILARAQLINAALIVFAAIALWYVGAGLPAYIYAYGAIAIFYNLQLYVQYRLSIHGRGRGAAGTSGAITYPFARIARMSLHVSFLSTVINSRKNVAVLVVSSLLGNVAAGLFGAALKCTAPLTKAADVTNQVLFSDIIKAFRSPTVPPERVRTLRLFSLAMLTTLMAAAAIGALLAEPLVGLVLDDRFLAAAPVLAVLVFVEALQIAGIVFNPVFQARGATTLLTAIYAVSMAAFVGAAFVLRSQLDIVSAAWLLLAAVGFAYFCQLVLVAGPRGLILRRSDA